MKKKELEKMLNNKCYVMFYKLNGELRNGFFKLNPDKIYNTDAVAVIDTTEGTYRAIKASSVITIEVV